MFGKLRSTRYLRLDIYTEEVAWELAGALAKAEPERYVNIHVVYVRNKYPVLNYEDKMISKK